MQLFASHQAETPPLPLSHERFEALFQVDYLPKLTFADWKTEQEIKKKCAKAQSKDKISSLAFWLGHYHTRELMQAFSPPLSIRWIDQKIGYGLFAESPLKPWSFIGEYAGLLRKRSRLFPDINDYCFMYPKEWLGWGLYTIDSKDRGNYTRFINHSDEPNCEAIAVFYEGIFRIVLRTIKEIVAGEQLTYDYGDIYWRERKKLKISRTVP